MTRLFIALLGLLLTVSFGFAQSSYRLKSGDRIAVEVLEDEQLNRTLLVLPDGSINFPFAGRVRAGGRTVGQVQDAITAGIASNFAATPTVFVTVSGLRPKEEPIERDPQTIKIYFTGEVNTPGMREVVPGTTFLQAISQSGGLSKFAATKRIQLRRSDSLGNQQVFVINYRALTRGAALNRKVVLREGDVILVPERRLFE